MDGVDFAGGAVNSDSERDGFVHGTGGDQDGSVSNAVLFNKIASSQRVSRCPLSCKGAPVLDYKNVELLRKFTSERGRVLPSRLTGVCGQKQRELKKCIKAARMLALLPFATQQD